MTPQLLRRRSARWLQWRIEGLMSADTRLSRALQDPSPVEVIEPLTPLPDMPMEV